MKKILFFVFANLLMSCSSEGEEVLNLPPSSFEVLISQITDVSAELTWGVSEDPEGRTVVYSVTLNGEIVAENLNETSLSLTELVGNTEYKVVVVATDDHNNSIEIEKLFTTSITNLAPEDFEINIDNVSYNMATISWTESVDPNGDVVVYDVYLDGSIVASNLQVLNFVLEGLQSTTSYTVKVVSKDAELTTEVEKMFETNEKDPIIGKWRLYLHQDGSSPNSCEEQSIFEITEDNKYSRAIFYLEEGVGCNGSLDAREYGTWKNNNVENSYEMKEDNDEESQTATIIFTENNTIMEIKNIENSATWKRVD